MLRWRGILMSGRGMDVTECVFLETNGGEQVVLEAQWKGERKTSIHVTSSKHEHTQDWRRNFIAVLST